MRKSYSLIEIFEGVRTMSDLSMAIAKLQEIRNIVPGNATMSMAFQGSHFKLIFDIEPKDKDDRKYYARLGFSRRD